MRYFKFKKSLKCIKCEEDNIISANYCKNCGYHFSEKEQKAAKKWTFVWFLETIDTIKGLPKLSFIKESKIYKVGSVLAILLVGIYFFLVNGIHLKLEESDHYRIDYNKELSEYYLSTQDEKIELNLYVPNRARDVSIKHLNQSDQVLDTILYQKENPIVLEEQGDDSYYLIEAKYENNSIDQIKLYVFLEVMDDEK